MITNEILVKNTLNIKPNTLEDYTINIMDMLGVDIDYSSMFKEKNKIVDKSTGKVVCERKIVSADTFIKLKYLKVIKKVKHLHHFMIKKILILQEHLQKLIG